MNKANFPSTDDAILVTLDRLCEELAVIRQVLDEVRSELQWANQNRPDSGYPSESSRRITSMPLDPTATDWAERVNRLSPADLPSDERKPAKPTPFSLF